MCADLSCGAFHTICVTVDGFVYAWGDNRHRQLGVPTWTNTEIGGTSIQLSKPVTAPKIVNFRYTLGTH